MQVVKRASQPTEICSIFHKCKDMRLGHDDCLNVCSYVLMKETCIGYACDMHDDDDDDDGLK